MNKLTPEAKLIQMLQSQDELNCRLSNDWKLRDEWDHKAALLVEAAEFLDYTGYKWWKQVERPSLVQVQYELIDIWHFALNLILVSDVVEPVVDGLHEDLALASMGKGIDEERCRRAMRIFVGNLCKSTEDEENGFLDLATFFIICEAYELSFDKIYDLYMQKNVLNRFRWDNGYKEGTYVKEWHGKEDNVMLEEIAASIGDSEDRYERIYDSLNEIYVSMIRAAQH